MDTEKPYRRFKPPFVVEARAVLREDELDLQGGARACLRFMEARRLLVHIEGDPEHLAYLDMLGISQGQGGLERGRISKDEDGHGIIITFNELKIAATWPGLLALLKTLPLDFRQQPKRGF